MKTKKQKNKATAPYFKVVTSKDNGRAEMFLYGYIGQDYWWDEDMKEESLTDLEFTRALRELEKEHNEIHIRINSPGGSVYHGDPIISAIQASPAKIHTYNDGMAASMAADIWLAGDVRHMARNAKMMIHATGTIAIGTAKDMRAAADMLDKFDSVAISMLSELVDMPEDDVRELFYDYEDHWMTAKDVAEMGLIDKPDDYEAEDMPDEPEKMSHADLVRFYHSGKVEIGFSKETEAILGNLLASGNGIARQVSATALPQRYETSATTEDKIEVEAPATPEGSDTMTVVQALEKILND